MARSASAWVALVAQLPVGKDPESRARRRRLFELCDVNDNSCLSLAEVDKGLRASLEAEDDLTDSRNARTVVMRGFQAAKASVVGQGGHPDFLEWAEFRRLLAFVREFYEMWVAYNELDGSGDKRLSLPEYKLALSSGKLRRWIAQPHRGVEPDDEAEFAAFDRSGSGILRFDDFAEAVLSRFVAREVALDGADGAADGQAVDAAPVVRLGPPDFQPGRAVPAPVHRPTGHANGHPAATVSPRPQVPCTVLSPPRGPQERARAAERKHLLRNFPYSPRSPHTALLQSAPPFHEERPPPSSSPPRAPRTPHARPAAAGAGAGELTPHSSAAATSPSHALHRSHWRSRGGTASPREFASHQPRPLSPRASPRSTSPRASSARPDSSSRAALYGPEGRAGVYGPTGREPFGGHNSLSRVMATANSGGGGGGDGGGGGTEGPEGLAAHRPGRAELPLRLPEGYTSEPTAEAHQPAQQQPDNHQQRAAQLSPRGRGPAARTPSSAGQARVREHRLVILEAWLEERCRVPQPEARQYAAALVGFGASCPEDLIDVGEADLAKLGFRPLHTRHLVREAGRAARARAAEARASVRGGECF